MYWLPSGAATPLYGYDGKGIYGFCGGIKKDRERKAGRTGKAGDENDRYLRCLRALDKKSVQRL